MRGGESENSISLCRKLLVSSAALAGILLLIYSNSLDCGWHLDDFHSIIDNPNIQLKGLTKEGIAQSFHSEPNHPEKLYRPVAGLTFALNYLISGTSPLSYHLVNLIIHWLCAFFLFLFLLQTLTLSSFHGKYTVDAYSIALLSAVLWAVNPIHTQSVTYVVQRMTSLAGLFYIASLFLYAKARTALDGKRSLLYGALCFTAFVLALGSKENAALLPASVLLYEALIVQEDMNSWIKRNKIYVFVALGLVVILGVLYVSCRREGLLPFLTDYGERPFTLVQRLLTQPRVVLFYLSLIFYPLPSRLSISHSFEISTSLFHPWGTFLAILALAGAIAFAFLFSRKFRLLSFCLLFFLVNHLLESTVLPLELVFEHRNYVPSMLLLVPVSIGICCLLRTYGSSSGMQGVMVAFVSLLLIGLGHATYLRNFTWESEETLWSDAVEKAPEHLRPHHNLGVAFEKQGRLREAVDEFEKALRSKAFNRRTEKIVTYYHLGRAHQQLGDLERAKGFYEQAVQMDGNLSPALVSLAVAYSEQGDDAKSFAYLERALLADLHNPYVNFNMGLHHVKHGEMDRAEPYFSKALVDEALRGSASLYLGILYKQRGQMGRAAIYLKTAATENPKDISPHLHLIDVYDSVGLKQRSLQEGEIVLDMIGKDEALLRETIALVLSGDGASGVRLQGEAVITIVYQVLNKRANVLESRLSHLKKILDKNGKIE